MALNAQYTQEYFNILHKLDGDIAGRRAAFNYLQTSTAIVHNEVVPASFIPRLFDRKTHAVMEHTATTMHGILCKVISHYLKDPSYRRAFHFDPRLEKLMLLPRGYDSLLPFARVDTFLNEDNFRVSFCEFNADGSSGMNEDRELVASITGSNTYRNFTQNHQVRSSELFDSWVQTFLNIYSTYDHRVDQPRVAICDYLENAVLDEFKVYVQSFARLGIECVISDVRQLRFDGETLRDADGGRIDALWRRCVGNDVLTYWDESQALINAVTAEKVALIGSFAGHLVHDKQLFKVLFDKRTLSFLGPEEISFIEKTVPLTTFLDDGSVNVGQIRANKDEWIIKPTDHYGADEVFAGCYASQQTWDKLIDTYANSAAGYPFLVQRYIYPFKTQTLPPDSTINNISSTEVKSDPVRYNNMNGLYLYDGRFVGVFSRLGPLPTIAKDMQGLTAATLWVD